jgi:hypothetical protein
MLFNLEATLFVLCASRLIHGCFFLGIVLTHYFMNVAVASPPYTTHTQYLRKSCPAVYPEELASSLPDWPSEPTIGCSGSSGMTTCIRNLIGTIGYLDAGHGISAGLTEVELQNEAETLQTSQAAAAKGGIEAAEGDALPDSPTDDFSQVSLLNQPGEFTWPIVQMTYIYVRKDLTTLGVEPNEQSLTVAFLKSLYDPDYDTPCIDDFGFTRVSAATRQFALDAIDTLIVNDNATEWIFEDSTTKKIIGAGDFVISKKRNNFLAVSADSLTNMAEDMQEQVTVMRQQVFEANEQILMLEAQVKDIDIDSLQGGREYTDDDDKQLKVALALSSISFILWTMAAAMWLIGLSRKTGGGGGAQEKTNDIMI